MMFKHFFAVLFNLVILSMPQVLEQSLFFFAEKNLESKQESSCSGAGITRGKGDPTTEGGSLIFSPDQDLKFLNEINGRQKNFAEYPTAFPCRKSAFPSFGTRTGCTGRLSPRPRTPDLFIRRKHEFPRIHFEKINVFFKKKFPDSSVRGLQGCARLVLEARVRIHPVHHKSFLRIFIPKFGIETYFPVRT